MHEGVGGQVANVEGRLAGLFHATATRPGDSTPAPHIPGPSQHSNRALGGSPVQVFRIRT